MKDRRHPRGKGLAAAVSALVAATGGTALAQEEETLRFSHWIPPVHVLHETGFVPWAESIAEASNGTLTIEFYPSQQLGNAVDHYDMAKDGIADITFVNPGYQAGRFPILAVAELPFLISDSVAGSEVIHEWYQKHAEEEMGDVKVCHVFLHAPASIHSKEPMHGPEDLEGLKVRPAHATMALVVNELGGSSVQVPAPEIREALLRGVADAVTTPWGSVIRPWGINEGVSYSLDMDFYSGIFVDVINKDAYDSLSEEHQQIIDDHCTPEWSRRIVVDWAAHDEAGRQELIDMEEHTVIEPTEDELQRWREKVAPVTDEWIESASAAGIDGEAALSELKSMLSEADALASE